MSRRRRDRQVRLRREDRRDRRRLLRHGQQRRSRSVPTARRRRRSRIATSRAARGPRATSSRRAGQRADEEGRDAPPERRARLADQGRRAGGVGGLLHAPSEGAVRPDPRQGRSGRQASGGLIDDGNKLEKPAQTERRQGHAVLVLHVMNLLGPARRKDVCAAPSSSFFALLGLAASPAFAGAPRRLPRRPRPPRRRRRRRDAVAPDGQRRAQEVARRELRRLQVRHDARTSDRRAPEADRRALRREDQGDDRRHGPGSLRKDKKAELARIQQTYIAFDGKKTGRGTSRSSRTSSRTTRRVDDGALGERGRQEPAPVLLLLRAEALEDVHLARRLDDPRGQAELRHVQGRDGGQYGPGDIDERHDHVAHGRVRCRARSTAQGLRRARPRDRGSEGRNEVDGAARGEGAAEEGDATRSSRR